MMCPCDHKRYCELGQQQVAFKELLKKSKGEKMDRASQLAVVEAVQFADNVVGRTSTKRKTRMAIETIPMDDLTEMEVPQKSKIEEVTHLSEKEQKIMKIAEVCGVDLPYGNRSTALHERNV